MARTRETPKPESSKSPERRPRRLGGRRAETKARPRRAVQEARQKNSEGKPKKALKILALSTKEAVAERVSRHQKGVREVRAAQGKLKEVKEKRRQAKGRAEKRAAKTEVKDAGRLLKNAREALDRGDTQTVLETMSLVSALLYPVPLVGQTLEIARQKMTRALALSRGFSESGEKLDAKARLKTAFNASLREAVADVDLIGQFASGGISSVPKIARLWRMYKDYRVIQAALGVSHLLEEANKEYKQGNKDKAALYAFAAVLKGGSLAAKKDSKEVSSACGVMSNLTKAAAKTV